MGLHHGASGPVPGLLLQDLLDEVLSESAVILSRRQTWGFLLDDATHELPERQLLHTRLGIQVWKPATEAFYERQAQAPNV